MAQTQSWKLSGELPWGCCATYRCTFVFSKTLPFLPLPAGSNESPVLHYAFQQTHRLWIAIVRTGLVILWKGAMEVGGTGGKARKNEWYFTATSPLYKSSIYLMIWEGFYHVQNSKKFSPIISSNSFFSWHPLSWTFRDVWVFSRLVEQATQGLHHI